MKGKGRRAFVATAVQGVVLLVAVAQFAFPVLGAYHSTRDIAQQALLMRNPGEPIATYQFFHHTLHYYTNYQVAEKLDTPESVVKFMQSHPTALIVTKSTPILRGITVTRLYTQGNFQLLRLEFRRQSP
jgi:hypothetical protein